MAADRKLSDEEVDRLRRLCRESGWTLADLGEAFGVTPQYAGRLVRGEQRATIEPPAEEPPEQQSVGGAVERMLRHTTARLGGAMESADDVLAATAQSLASKIDACAGSSAATSAQAMPRLVAELVGVLDRLRERVPREPDGIDAIRARRNARIAATRERNGLPPVEES